MTIRLGISRNRNLITASTTPRASGGNVMGDFEQKMAEPGARELIVIDPQDLPEVLITTGETLTDDVHFDGVGEYQDPDIAHRAALFFLHIEKILRYRANAEQERRDRATDMLKSFWAEHVLEGGNVFATLVKHPDVLRQAADIATGADVDAEVVDDDEDVVVAETEADL